MPIHQTTSERRATWGTHSHGEETLVSRATGTPSQMRWGDFLPDLAARFELAAQRLEGLLYAVCGSRPMAYPWVLHPGQYQKCQWYDRLHPRCLWPEVWQRHRLASAFGQPGCVSEQNMADFCYDYTVAERAALGFSVPCCPQPAPTVPVRSRSGEPAYQFRQAVHDGTIFPVGSVARGGTTFPHDPEGSGWFGATNPGREDAGANLWLTLANGYTHKNGATVTFTWTRPDGVLAPTANAILFFYRQKPPGAAWSNWASTSMPNVGGNLYSLTRGPFRHGTQYEWYLYYRYVDPEGEDADVIAYEPGGASPPSATQVYSLTWYTHWASGETWWEYNNGLPEANSAYRHGTDWYEFDGSETIQYQMLNQMRWVLSWLGASCCNRETEGCSDIDPGSWVTLHHNPRSRTNAHDQCCIPMPIRFRWSGSNQHPHYLEDGKLGAASPSPITSKHINAGTVYNRLSWRGAGPLFAGVPFSNPKYGMGGSWAVEPGCYKLIYLPDYSAEADVHQKFDEVGLRPGDVIDAIHLEEIIAAVDYLVRYGAWVTVPLCTRYRTSTSWLGVACGRYDAWYGASHDTSVDQCQRCCASCPDGVCVPYSKPTWADCVADCRNETCTLSATDQAAWNNTTDHGVETYSYLHQRAVNCGGIDSLGAVLGLAGVACGWHYRKSDCHRQEYDGSCVAEPDPDGVVRGACADSVRGLAYYACGPSASQQGWDANHGNGLMKARRDHTWHVSGGAGMLNVVATGPTGKQSAGNKLGDLFACGDVLPQPGGDQGLWFGEVAEVQHNGLATAGWWGGCAVGSGCPGAAYGETLPAEVPGMGHFGIDEVGDPKLDFPLCTAYHLSPDGTGRCTAEHTCACDASNLGLCTGALVWGAIDLNLDGTGVPYMSFTGRNGDQEGYVGNCIPTLRDYDLTLPVSTMPISGYACPCETVTGAGACT